MSEESQHLEYKDFSRDLVPNRKSVEANLFREIAAFANTSGGKIIVGKEDGTWSDNKQPDCIYQWLSNDSLTISINRLSQDLIVFKSYKVGALIHIDVNESDDVISARADATGINRDDCFIRENHQTIKAKGEKLRKLIEKKITIPRKKRKGT